MSEAPAAKQRYETPRLRHLQVSAALMGSVRRRLELWGDWVGSSQHAGSSHWSEVLEKLGYIERPAHAASCPGDGDDIPLAVDAAIAWLGKMDPKAQWVVIVNYTMPGSQGNKANIAGIGVTRFKAILHSGELFVAAILLRAGIVTNADAMAA